MVITNNGKPTALLLDICNDDLEETLLALRQVRAMRLFNRMRADAQRRGFLSKKEIDFDIGTGNILFFVIKCSHERLHIL